jgi:DNA-binding MarR family transcriptional regulator
MLQRTGGEGRRTVTGPGDGAPSLVEQLTVLQRTAARGLADVLADDGCTVEQWRVLRALGDGGGHLMGELAARLVVPQPSLTRVVDQLSDRSLVYRRQGDRDRRRVEVYLSRQGRARLDRVEALVRGHEETLRADPAWAAMRRALRRLA